MKGVVYLSIFIGEQPEVFAQEIDMICVRTLSLRPQLKKKDVGPGMGLSRLCMWKEHEKLHPGRLIAANLFH